jgi:hypothetical protein
MNMKIPFSSILHIEAFTIHIEPCRQRRQGHVRSSSIRSSPACSPLSSHQTFFADLDALYTEASTTIKCPFFKRRIADTIDNVAMITRFLIIRHKSLWPVFGIDDLGQDGYALQMQVPGCKAIGRHIQVDQDGKSVKHMNLPIETIRDVIVQDWRVHPQPGSKTSSLNTGYYITGKLNSTIYTDDCMFDGPDPDMPVKGLRKYLGAASNLFDSSKSSATLLDIQIVEIEPGTQSKSQAHSQYGNKVIEVKWRLQGVLMLPWRPSVKPWSGWTRYHFDENGLIAYHEEGWDISVLEAFVGTILPEVGERIWGDGTPSTKDICQGEIGS